MLYPYEESVEIVLRIYEYLQVKAVRDMPHSIKMEKPRHKQTVDNFITTLPTSAGVDYVWKFLTYQFYIYSQQHQVVRASAAWFMGKEAWKRWREYDEGISHYVKNWVLSRKLVNPVKCLSFQPVSEEVLDAERYRMSRISGPNYCEMKYGNDPYDLNLKVCKTCPFKSDCVKLFGTKDVKGKNIVQQIAARPKRKGVKQSKVKVMQEIRQTSTYYEEGD